MFRLQLSDSLFIFPYQYFYMRLPLLLLFIFFIIQFTNAQSPGGIATNNTMWLRSDVGLTSAANIVSQWQEISGAAVTGNFTVQSLNGTSNTQTGPSVIDAGINFNPYLRFDGITNSLSSTNLFSGTSLVTNSNVTVFQVLNVKGGIVWLKWETDQVGSTARLGFENSAGRIRFDFPKAVPATAGQNVGITNVLNQHALSTTYADATSSTNRLNGNADNTIAIPGPGDFSAVTDKIVIGNENLINLPAQVDIAEIIIYASTLTAAERNKIETYLAVKYGFTLDQSAANGNDYTSTNGTIIWNRAANAGYAANITGIGRDNATGLMQRQSKSINTAALITLYNSNTYAAGNFPLTNATNANDFTTDQSFLLIGDNAGTTTLDQCIFNGKGQRMQRVWKVSQAGPLSPVTYAVDQAAVPAGVKNIIVSNDPAFPAAASSLHPLTIANGKLYTDLILNPNDYFTYASDTLTVTMVPTEPLCTNPNSGSVATTVSGGNPPLTYSWSPSAQNTANLTAVAGGTYTLTIAQGTCQATYSVTLTNPSAPSAPAANAVSICSGNTAVLQVQSPNASYTYNWYAAATGGTALGTGTSFTTPVLTTNTTYYLEAVNGSCVSVRTAVTVSINTITTAVVNPITVCDGNTGTLQVQSPNASYTYNWYNAATGGTLLGSGTSFTTPALSVGTTYYVEPVNNSCPGTRTAVTVGVTTVPPPTANAVEVCQGSTATLNIVSPVAGITYNWYTVATGGTVDGTGTSYTTAPVNATGTLYVESFDGTCSSIRTGVGVSLIAPLDTPKVSATTIAPESITFSWPPVAGAAGYVVSVDGGSYITPSSGSTGLSHTVNNLAHAQTVEISVIALSPPQGCGDSDPGHAKGTTYGDGFYVPAAFTPNGDTRNDVLTPVIPGGFILDYFTVFNRWGQKIFSTKIVGAGWDGKWKNRLQPMGTYVWICRYHYPGGRFVDEKGTVLLLQ